MHFSQNCVQISRRGVIITQHMPVGFTAPLAARFNRIAHMPVKETENGDILKTGTIFISKAGVHTMIGAALTADGKRTGRIIHSNAPPVHGVQACCGQDL